MGTGMRGRLIAEAEMLVKRRGYSGFSYADLAAVIGISKASIHHHFPAKEDLGAALIGNYKERYDAALQAIWAESASGIGRIAAYARLYLDGLRQDQGCLCGVMASERDILPQRLREGITRFFEEHLVWLERVLEAGIENGTIRPGIDPVAQAKLILSALEGVLMLGRLFDEKSEFDATVDQLGKSLR
jgi:TetR/AcrR family transcriptional repressor of nem operon